MGVVLACGLLIAAIPAVVAQDPAWLPDVEGRVKEFAGVLGIPVPAVKLSAAPMSLLAEIDSGAILIDGDAAKNEFSKQELDAALARETVFLARLGPNKRPHGGDLANLMEMGEHYSLQRRRVAFVGEMVDLLIGCKRSPVALLTLVEVELHRLRSSPLGSFPWELDALVLALRKQLADRAIGVERSAVSVTFRVRERLVGEQVAFELFGRELLRLSPAEAHAQLGVAAAFNAFFDRQPMHFEVVVRGSDLVLGGNLAVALGSPGRATSAALAIRRTLSEYERRLR